MSLREKLARLSGVGIPPPAEVRESSIVGQALLPGELTHTAHGPIRIIDSYYGLTDCHGNGELGQAYTSDAQTLAAVALQPELADVDVQGMLFIDTETTGLAGGTGTIPFLTGLSYFDGQQFVVEQLLIQGFGQEIPLLTILSERLARASCIVTFNGKSFDWPLLKSRYVMYGLDVPSPPPHLDLLHCLRRVLKRRLDSFRLVNLEKALLGFARVGDVDGSEIPGIYFEYLHSNEPGLMPSVIEHNRLDLLAMPAFLGWLAQRWQGSEQADARDLMGMAIVAERSGHRTLSAEFARQASLGKRGDAAAEANLTLARFAREDGLFDQEETYLLAALECGSPAWLPKVHLRLAIAYEHTHKCMDKAWHHAILCADGEENDSHRRRLARLRRKGDFSNHGISHR